MKLTSTGKKIPVSTPPMLNINDPVLLSSKAVMTGMDHARECAEVSRDHSPVWEETVGYDPLLKGVQMLIPREIGALTEEV